jgi:hypothetical protein
MNPASPAAPDPRPGAPALSCDEARRQLDCLIEEGDLKPTERALLSAHLNACPVCRKDLEARRQLEVRLKETLAALDTAPGFTQRLLHKLPPPATAASSSRRAAPRASSGVRPIPAGAPSAPGPRAAGAGRTWSLPALAVAALVLLAVALWSRSGPATPPSDLPPDLARCEGGGVLVRAGREAAATPGKLEQGDVLTTSSQIFQFALESQARALAEVRLASGAQLRIINRHRFFLVQGEACFDVHPGRPRSEEETFEVKTEFGSIQVVGTAFGIIVPKFGNHVTVLVDRGSVQVVPVTGAARRLDAGQECDLPRTGGVSEARAIQPGRMALLRPTAVAVAPALAPAPAPPPRPGLVPPAPPRPPPEFDWGVPVKLDFRGRTFEEALALLAECRGHPPELRALAKAAKDAGPQPPSAFCQRQPMPLAATVRWLARECGLRFDPPGTLRQAAPGEPLGPPEPGEPPPAWREALSASAAGITALGEWTRDLDQVAAQANVTVLVAPGAFAAPALAGPLRGSLAGALSQFARAAGLEGAFYDGLYYLAPPAQIEALTRVKRTLPAAAWMGDPAVPEWQLSLKRLAQLLAVDHAGRLVLGMEATPLLQEVEIHPDDPGLHFTAGVAGAWALDAAFRLLEQGSPAVASPAVLLDEHRVTGAFRDLAAFQQPAAQRQVRVELPREAEQDFPAQSFVARALPLGQALEWAARLRGLGLRAGAGVIQFAPPRECYGPPALQAVSLAHLAKRFPQGSRERPRALFLQARAACPELLAGVEDSWLPLKDALAFRGDLRQLAAVQRLLHELETALRAAPPDFNLAAWKAPWRAELDKNLAEPFQGDGSGTLPPGAFAGLLRQSGLFVQLRATVLVSPEAMSRVAGKQIPALDVRGQTLLQVIHTLARAAGLRVVVEDGVVWLKE